MDQADETIEILSTMSPRIAKKVAKVHLKATSKLSLKKYIRRSSIHDNLLLSTPKPALSDNSTPITSSASTSSCNEINSTPITISDSESDTSDKQDRKPVINDELFSKLKQNAIEDWINNVNKNVLKDNSQFSEVSTIYGEFKTNSKNPHAVNSTFINDLNRKLRFDELIKPKTVDEDSTNMSNIVIEDSFENELIKSNNEVIEDSFRNEDVNGKFNNSEQATDWRKNRHFLITQSEPKLKQNHKITGNNNTQSPWIQRFKGLCDSDTESDSDNNFDSYKPKVLFGGSNKGIKSIADKKSSNTEDKENLSDISIESLSLEDRIKKKTMQSKLPVLTAKKDDLGDYLLKKLVIDDKPKRKYVKKKVTVKTPEYNKLDIDFNRKKPQEPPIYSFLASLSGSVPLTKCNASARIFRNNFQLYKNELVTRLYKMFNENVFENALPADLPVEWNDKLRGTAGKCICKKITRKNGNVERNARITLASKVIDSADRLRDTFIHELCHAATWIVNEVSDGHGPYWKSWASKAMNTYPELPPIKRCHDYVINTKYTYKCTGCGYSFGRHSKSINIERKRCGYCHGKLELLINKTTKNGESKSVPVTPKKQATGFALFVKENYGIHKTPERNHAQVMQVLSVKYNELKVIQRK